MTLELDAQLLEVAHQLEPLPANVVQLIGIAGDPESGAHEIAQVLNMDQAMLAKVLAEANSASHASSSRVGTANDAVVRLGASRVVQLAVMGSTEAAMGAELDVYGLGAGSLAMHSQLTSTASEIVRAEAGVDLPLELVTASLLHDIGMLVVSMALEEPTAASLARAHRAGLEWFDAEREMLGVEHAEVSRVLVDAWGLPSEIGEAVQHHHSPHQSEGLMAHGVAIANAIAHAIADENGAWNPIDHTLASSLDILEIDPDRVESMITSTQVLWAKRTGDGPSSN
ncbi:MAG: HDOD domain-containing protein [Acidimicrobiales bacterium]